MTKWYQKACSFTILGLIVASGPLVGQEEVVVDDQIRDLVSKALPAGWVAPSCDIKDGHFLVGSGATYLKEATETSVRANKTRMYGDAVRVLGQAINDRGQEENGAAWYWLARAYARQGDLLGVDSSLTKAEAHLDAACAPQLTEFRRAIWISLARTGGEALQANDVATGRKLLLAADAIYQAEPNAIYLLGILAANDGNFELAAERFRAAADIAAQHPETLAGDRNQATYNLAVVLGNLGRHDEAVAAWQQYREYVPDDIEGMKGLAASYRATGQDDLAAEMESQIMAAASASGGNEDVSTTDLYNLGVNAFNDGDYAAAAGAFQAVIEREPHNRDALFNLTNAYYGLKDGENLVASAEQLLAMDPMNEFTLKLLGEGVRLTGDQDRLLQIITDISAAPISIDIVSFAPGSSNAILTAKAIGREPQDVQGDPIPSTPVNLVVEFMNEAEEVVASQQVTIPVLEPGTEHEFEVEGSGEGITWWRYSRQS